MKSAHEQALRDALEQASREYSAAIDEIDALAPSLSADGHRRRACEQLQQIAIRTRQTEQRVAQHRDVWRRSGESPGSELQQVLARQEAVLGELIRRINEIEQSARDVRDGLAETADAGGRSEEMRSAYARTVRQAIG